MAKTIEELESALGCLEQEIVRLKTEIDELRSRTLPDSGEKAKTENEQLSLLLEQAFDQMGVSGKPIGAEKVRQMMRECGVEPEERLFSRSIIEFREE